MGNVKRDMSFKGFRRKKLRSKGILQPLQCHRKDKKKADYRFVCLFKPDNKMVKRSIHRLVASAFIPNPEGKPEINHKNAIKHDNRVVNLEWVTGTENYLHAVKMGLGPQIGPNHAKNVRKSLNRRRRKRLALLGVLNSNETGPQTNEY